MAVTSEAAPARKSATTTASSRKSGNGNGTRKNGNGNGDSLATPPATNDLALILASLQTMRKGDFSVRLPVAWTGIQGKIADTFNDIVAANEQMAAGADAGRPGRRQRRAAPANAHASSSTAAPGARWKSRSTRWWMICSGRRRK